MVAGIVTGRTRGEANRRRHCRRDHNPATGWFTALSTPAEENKFTRTAREDATTRTLPGPGNLSANTEKAKTYPWRSRIERLHRKASAEMVPALIPGERVVMRWSSPGPTRWIKSPTRPPKGRDRACAGQVILPDRPDWRHTATAESPAALSRGRRC